MSSWDELIYQDWRVACGKSTPFKGNDYHKIYPEGRHPLRDDKGLLEIELQRDTFCLQFEKIRQELDSSKTLLKAGLTMRCDYMLCDDVNFLLAELTSGLSLENLENKTDKSTGLTKIEKVQEQLYTTYKTLCKAKSIEQRIESCTRKLALCSYTLSKSPHEAKRAFSRPLYADACADGKAYPSPKLDLVGIEYRRIAYIEDSPNPVAFTLS